MASLLGEGWDDPRSAAIMALAGGLLKGDFAGGLLGANDALAQHKVNALKQQMAQMQLEEMRARAEEHRAIAAQRQAEAQRQARIQTGIPGLFRQPGMTGGEAVPQTFSGTDVPMFSRPVGAAPMRQTPGGFDVQAALALGMNPKEIGDYAALANVGRPEVARTIEGVDASGRPVTRQFGKYGEEIGSPQGKFVAPHFQSLGNRVGVLDGVTGQERSSLPMGIDPGTIYTGNITMRGQNMTDARARQTAEQGKWQYDAQRGGLVNMQSGEFKPAMQNGQPVETKASREAAKEDLQKRSAISGAQGVLQEIRDAKGMVGWNTAGYGGMAAILPQSDARDLGAKLQTIKANLGFDRLQQMRSESPTGGALGQVAVQELQALQATIANLDQMQGPEQLGKNLDKIEKHYTNWVNVMQQHLSGKGGASGQWGIQKVN